MNVSAWAFEGDPCKEPYHYKGCGLDDVYLVSGYEIKNGSHGDSVSVKNLDDLHNAIGRHLVERKKLLTGKEIRFLRVHMELTQSELARLFGCDAQQIARYEKGENKIPGPADRLLRALFSSCHLDQRFNLRELLEEVDSLDDRQVSRQTFKDTPDGWKSAA